MSSDVIAPPLFVLPGSWWRVDLTSDEAMKTSIRRVVEESIGRQDDRARLRAELRDAIAAAAEPVREKGAVEFHIARELTAGVPLAASLAVFLVRTDLAPLEGMPASVVDMTVADALGDDGRIIATALSGGIRATRKSYRREVREREGIPAHEVVQADYWISAAMPARIAMLSFSTVFADFEDDMLRLFDAIVQTIRWEAGAAATQSEPLSSDTSPDP